ncbi:MAG: phosphotransferase family protein [Actinobacteria bacterium]|nr:phosphotransferase family protein [Actinomycetota bacterium]
MLRAPTGPDVIVEDLVRLSGGASRETWAFTVRSRNAEVTRSLVLQRERAGGSATSRQMGVQAELLRAAADAGVPVPGLVAIDADGSMLGAPAMVMERVEGETIARRILRDDAYGTARGQLTGQVGAALAALHRTDVSRLDGLDEVDQLAQMGELLDLLGAPHPAFEIGLRHLRATRPPTRGSGLVHGDFRMGNLVVCHDGLRAVLDWELAHIGDPAEDLGWFCVRAWRFGSPLSAGGVGSVEELVDAYVRAGGVAVSVEEVRWWEAFGTLRWGVICIMQAAAHLTGMSRSVELAAIGRRVAENEEDLLEILAGPSGYEPRTADAESVDVGHLPQDRPTAAELLDAVGEYLVEVRDGVDGRVGFHARVAANVVAIVRREIELGPAQDVAHRSRLASLGVADDAELAASIRSGAVDDRMDEVVAAVRASVRDKLAVSNPGYWLRP